MELLQVEAEFSQLLELYRKAKPRRVLEIGSWDGGTLKEWLAGEPTVAVAVDLEHRQEPKVYEQWRKPGTTLHRVTGSSQDAKVKDLVRYLGPYDWLFVDGDHTEPGVRNDVDLARSCAADGAIMVLHDIERGVGNEGDPAPRNVFEELQAEGLKTVEFVERPYAGHWAHGIGVVWL